MAKHARTTPCPAAEADAQLAHHTARLVSTRLPGPDDENHTINELVGQQNALAARLAATPAASPAGLSAKVQALRYLAAEDDWCFSAHPLIESLLNDALRLAGCQEEVEIAR